MSAADGEQVLYRVDQPPPALAEPMRVAIIGAGGRSRTIYAAITPIMKPWIKVVAVCDPVKANCDPMAQRLGVPAYYDVRQLLRDRPMDAAIIVTPVESHHSLSVFLSSHGIHNLVETTFSSMVSQAREMLATARKHNVVVRVAENFFRFPIDRFAQAVRDSGYLGRIGRVVSYADHTGYHNNSRWLAFAQSDPLWIQCVENGLDHPPFYSQPQRRHTRETLHTRLFEFKSGLFVLDVGSGHTKGFLGRHPRYGYTEWQGQRGTMVYRATGHGWNEKPQIILRRMSDDALAPAQEKRGNLNGGFADQITYATQDTGVGSWTRTYADTPLGRIEYVNPFDTGPAGMIHSEPWYGVPVMDHIADFALAARGKKESEFSDQHALWSEMLEVGAHESSLQEGRRIKFPLEGDLEHDAITRAALKKKYGVDPMDVEAMLSISYPKP